MKNDFFVTRENHCWIASLMTKIFIHGNSGITFYIFIIGIPLLVYIETGLWQCLHRQSWNPNPSVHGYVSRSNIPPKWPLKVDTASVTVAINSTSACPIVNGFGNTRHLCQQRSNRKVVVWWWHWQKKKARELSLAKPWLLQMQFWF